MLESTISNLLQKVLGDFLNINDLSFGLMQGEIKLKNIQLKSHVLSPLHLQEGSVKHFEVMLGNPIKVILEELKMLVTDEFTIKQMTDADLKKQKKDTLNTHEVMQKPQQPGYLSSMMMNVVDSIHVDINKIYIEFVSSGTRLIIVLSRLAIVNTNESQSRKLLALDGLSIKMIVGGEEVMILEPVHASGTLGITKDYSLDISLPDIDIKLPRKHYVELMRIAQHLHLMFLKQSQPLVNQRPSGQIFGNAKIWWLYVIKTIAHNIHSKHTQWDYATIKIFRERWRAYMKLWTCKIENLQFDQQQLTMLEDIMDADTLMWIRDIVKVEVEEKRRKHPQHSNSWLSWLTAPKEVDTDKEHIDESKAKSVESPIIAQNKQITGVFNVITFKLSLINEDKKFQFYCRDFKLSANFINNILTSDLSLMDLGVIDHLTPNNPYPMMITPLRKHLKVGKIVNLQETNEQLLQMHFRYDPHATTPSELSINTLSLVIVVQPNTLFHLNKYFKLPTNLDGILISDDNINEMKAYSKAGLQFAIETHRSLNIDFKLNAPCLLIPSHHDINGATSDVSTICMAINMGFLHIKSNLTDSTIKNINDIDNDTITKMAYDHYTCDLQGIQISYHTDINKVLECAINDNIPSCNILEKCTLNIDFAKSIIPDNHDIEQFKLDMVLDAIVMHLSPLNIQYLLQTFLLFQPANMDQIDQIEQNKDKITGMAIPSISISFKLNKVDCHFHNETTPCFLTPFANILVNTFKCHLTNNNNVIRISPTLTTFNVTMIHNNNEISLVSSISQKTMLCGTVEYIQSINKFKSDLICDGLHFNIQIDELEPLQQYANGYLKIFSGMAKGDTTQQDVDTSTTAIGSSSITIKDIILVLNESTILTATGLIVNTLLGPQSKSTINLTSVSVSHKSIIIMRTPHNGLLQCAFANSKINCLINKPQLFVNKALFESIDVFTSVLDAISSDKQENNTDNAISVGLILQSPEINIHVSPMNKFKLTANTITIKSTDYNIYDMTLNNISLINDNDVDHHMIFENQLMDQLTVSINPLSVYMCTPMLNATINHTTINNLFLLMQFVPELSNPTQVETTADSAPLAMVIDINKCNINVSTTIIQLDALHVTMNENDLEDIRITTQIALINEDTAIATIKGIHVLINKDITVDVGDCTATLNIPIFLELSQILMLDATEPSNDAATSTILINTSATTIAISPILVIHSKSATIALNNKLQIHLFALIKLNNHAISNEFEFIMNSNMMVTCHLLSFEMNLMEFNTLQQELQLVDMGHSNTTQNTTTSNTTYRASLPVVLILDNGNIPLLKSQLTIDMEYATITNNMNGTIQMSLLVFNPSQWSYEPFIEELEFKITSDLPNILVTMDKMMNINASKYIVQGLMSLNTNNDAIRSNDASIGQIINKLGIPIKITQNGTNTTITNTHNIHSLSPLTAITINEFDIDQSLFKDGHYIHKLHQQYVLITISTRALHGKQITLTSMYKFINKTTNDVYINTKQHHVVVPPDETYDVPLSLIHEKFKFKLNNVISPHTIHWKDFIGSSSDHSNTRALQFDTNYLIIHGKYDEHVKMTVPIMSCYISAPLTISNELPVNMIIMINNMAYTVEANKKQSVYPLLLDNTIYCQIIINNAKSKSISLDNNQQIVQLTADKSTMNIHLTSNINMGLGGLLECRIYSDYQIINHLLFPIKVQCNNQQIMHLESQEYGVYSECDYMSISINKTQSRHFNIKDGLHGMLQVGESCVLGVSMLNNVVHVQPRLEITNLTDTCIEMRNALDSFKIEAKETLGIYKITTDHIFTIYDTQVQLNKINNMYIAQNDQILKIEQRLINGQFHINLSRSTDYPYVLVNNSDLKLLFEKSTVEQGAQHGFILRQDKTILFQIGEITHLIPAISITTNHVIQHNNKQYLIKCNTKNNQLLIIITNDTKNSLASPNAIQSDLLKPLLNIKIHVRAIGLSIISNNKELIYMINRQISLNYTSSKYLHYLEVMVQYIQIDNQLMDASNMVMVYPSNNNKEIPMLQFKCLLSKEYEDIVYVKLASVALQETTIDLEEDHIRMLIDWANACMTVELDNKDNKDNKETHTNDTDASPLYFDLLQINPLLLNVSFTKGQGQQAKIVNMVSSTLMNIHDTELKLNALILEHLYGNMDIIKNQLIEHYTQTMYGQIYKIVGGADMLGNPIGLFTNISSGVLSIFYEPYLGIINERPDQIISGLAYGTETFVRKTVFGLSDTFTKLTSSMGKGLSSITLDKDYLKHRRINKNRNKPRHAIDGFTSGAKLFTSSVVSGITGIVDKPMSGATERGVGGFFVGIGHGLLGAVSKPLVGIADMATSIGEGIRSTASEDTLVDRIRYPRYIGNNEGIRPYEAEASEAQYILRVSDQETYEEDYYVKHYVSKVNTIILIISNNHVMLVSRKIYKTMWVLEIRDSGVCYSDKNNVILMGIDGEQYLVEFKSNKEADDIAKELQSKIDELKLINKSRLVYKEL